MKVAWCLRGQPRDVDTGHRIIRSFINKHPSVTFDFYCHTWYDPDPNHRYAVSTYRGLGDVRQDIDVIGKIDRLYNPVKHSIEAPKDFDIEPMMNSKAIQKIRNLNMLNVKNTTSNIYSQTQVRNLLFENMKNKYDYIISSRYDMHKEITLDLFTLEKDNIYCSAVLYPRKCFYENMYIMPPSIFFDVCSIYSILDKLINNLHIEAKLNATGEELVYVPEGLMTASLYYFNYMEKVIYTPAIPNFI